jgi:S-adenosylmethionine hydrolase
VLRIELTDEGRPSRTHSATWERTFGRVPIGATLVYEDSFGQLALADNQGDVAARLGLRIDQPAVVRAG